MSFSVTILGSGGAMPSNGRFPSSQLIRIGSESMLVDCGESAQMQLIQAGVNLHKISAIFISHLHGDHYLGLMGLLFTMHLTRRTGKLMLFGPSGLDEIITVQLRHSRSTLCYPIQFESIQYHPNPLVETKGFTVTAFPLNHRIPCFGFLFREKPKVHRLRKEELPSGISITDLNKLKRGEDLTDDSGNLRYKNSELTWPPHKPRAYAYCSDTAYFEPLIPVLKQIDLLYHEATFMEADRNKATETFHSTAADAALMAKNCQASKLLLGHFSARYKELEPLLLEARNIFPNSELALETMTFTIPE